MNPDVKCVKLSWFVVAKHHKILEILIVANKHITWSVQPNTNSHASVISLNLVHVITKIQFELRWDEFPFKMKKKKS